VESQKQNEVAVTAMRIFRPPLRATVTLQEGRPAHIACLKRKEICGEILWAAGPWRTSGDWWEQEGWARDEWDIALQEASGITLYRLVRDLLSGQWRVEGNYD
jgi:protein ImuB